MNRRLKWLLLGSLFLSLTFCSFYCSKAECKFDADCPKQTHYAFVCRNQLCVQPERIEDDGGTSTEQGRQECQNGFKRSCYTAHSSTQNVGVCRGGEQICQKGVWGPCLKEIKPGKERCDNDLDDNCNGLVNEGCRCAQKGSTRPCYRGNLSTQSVLPCHAGSQECLPDNTWSAVCEQQALPKKEECNGLDDDCNGQIDDNCPCKPKAERSCYVSFQAQTFNKGICKEGKMICTDANKWGNCVGAVGPKRTEICNGADDNCDGAVDEGCACRPGETQECYTGPKGTLGKGICAKGQQSCTAKGQWGPCFDQVPPQDKEICNGKDDDCDGQIDEQLNAPKCGLQQGTCTGSRRPCGGQKGWLACSVLVYERFTPNYEQEETRCDNIDNDCDGQIDEQLLRACYTESKGCQKSGAHFTCEGSCSTGVQSCQSGHWSGCTRELHPQSETCNGLDDDCDGIIDNGCSCTPGAQQSCYTGTPQSAGKGICKKGKQTCVGSGQWGACLGDVQPQKEQCNGKDDDCNGQIDDGLTRICYTGPQGTAGVGPCTKGTSTCNQGQFTACTKETTPRQEICGNRIDDDCDGQIDETDGRALTFMAPAHRLDVPHNTKLNLLQSFTIEFWYKLTSTQNTKSFVVLSKQSKGTSGYQFALVPNSKQELQCTFRWWDSKGKNERSLRTCTTRTWTHIALIYDQGTRTLKLYVNGLALHQENVQLNIVGNTENLSFGGDPTTAQTEHFEGQLASIRFSKGVRYSTGFVAPCTFKAEFSTLATWNLDEGQGNVLRDSSPNQLHGNRVGASWSLGRPCNGSRYGGCK